MENRWCAGGADDCGGWRREGGMDGGAETHPVASMVKPPAPRETDHTVPGRATTC